MTRSRADVARRSPHKVSPVIRCVLRMHILSHPVGNDGSVAFGWSKRLQHLLTDATWDPQALDQQRVTALVAQSLPQGILVLDDTRLPKQERSSVGVARQYSGTLGK